MIYYHGGGTDSNGGHRDRKNGGYHYHHGEPAHQHPNGICEYKAYEYKENNVAKSSEFNYTFIIWIILLTIFTRRYNLHWFQGRIHDNTFEGKMNAAIEYFVYTLIIYFFPTYLLFFKYLPDWFSYKKEYSFLLVFLIIIYLEIRKIKKSSSTIESIKIDKKVSVKNFKTHPSEDSSLIESIKIDKKVSVKNFKIHPSEDSSFYEWVSFIPSSFISSIGRKQKIANKKPSNISKELIEEFEKNYWGKISFDEFLENYKK